jgi:hypothetical protein
MYQKQKMISTPQVDMEELKRQLRSEVLRDLRPIPEAKEYNSLTLVGL